YVSDPEKRAIEGHFLVGTETAYTAAWNIHDDRFGNPFVVGKSYRDKIQSWHKIATKESKDLREFVDFLGSVESAMPYVQEVLTPQEEKVVDAGGSSRAREDGVETKVNDSSQPQDSEKDNVQKVVEGERNDFSCQFVGVDPALWPEPQKSNDKSAAGFNHS
ncbi:uncharacterized protein LOC113048957, partial [Tachysurus ichikawai]